MGLRALSETVPSGTLESLLDALNDPVVASNASGLILYTNAAAERLLGRAPRELLGKPLTSIMPARLRAAHEAGFHRYMATGQSRIMGRPIRVPALHRDGTEIDIELTLSELHPRAAELVVIAILRDLRERVELERKVDAQQKLLAQYETVRVLAESENAGQAMPRLLEATATALQWDVGIYWGVDPASRRLVISATWSSGSAAADGFIAESRSHTFGEGEGLPGQVFASKHVEWSRNIETDARYLRAQAAGTRGLRSALLFPVFSPGQTWGVLEFLTTRQEDVDEELRQTMTVVGDQIGRFLERVKREEQLHHAWAEADAAKKNLEQLFQDAPAVIAILRGAEMRYTLSNAVNQFYARGRQLVGKTVREALPAMEADGVMAILGHVYATGEPHIAEEQPATRPATGDAPESRVFMNGVFQPLRGADGGIDGVMIFGYDVTDLVTARERVKEAEERLRLAVEAGKLGTWELDLRTGAVHCDLRYRMLFGLGPNSELNGGILRAAIHPDDLGSVSEATLRSFDPGAGGDYQTEFRARGIEDGIERWLAVRGRTSFDDQHRPCRIVGPGIDITRERQALERQQLLAQVSTILSGSLDHHDTLPKVAALLLPRLADWCAIDLVRQEGGQESGQEGGQESDEKVGAEHVALSHSDPAKIGLAREMNLRDLARRLASGDSAGEVAPSQPILVSHLTDAMLAAAARAPDDLAILRELGLRSAMLLPLRARDRTTGMLSLFRAGSGRRYTAEDLAFGDELARTIAVAVENARLFDQATRAIGIRDQFLSIASHELRTPLTSLTLQLSSLSRLMSAGSLTTMPAEKLEGRLARMDRQAERLADLVGELLDVSRISTGVLTIERRPTDLVEIAREVLERLAEEAKAAGCRLELEAPTSLIGSWDRNRLDQVLSNLVGNAIKYAGGSPIAVEVAARGEHAHLSVRDRGPGIAEANQKRIFEQFERAAPSAMAGLGLGLWLASRIVGAHGGKIGVESRVDEGALFVVELPLDSPA